MTSKEEIREKYISSARFLIEQGKPNEARLYVLQILNICYEIYNDSTDILLKLKTRTALKQWLIVSRELYDFGITDYVLECFDLPRKNSLPQDKHYDSYKPATSSLSDDSSTSMSGLIDQMQRSQTPQSWKEKVFYDNINAVVNIYGSTSNDTASGTGFIISPKGYLLTNHHVVFDENSCAYYSTLTMSFKDKNRKHKIQVLSSDKEADIALCRFNTSEVKSFSCVKRISDYSTVKQAQECMIIGNAFDYGLAPVGGVIRYSKSKSGNLVCDARANPGDSGGPVFNIFGECIGINKSRTKSIDGEQVDAFTNATPMDKIYELLNKWTKRNNIVL